MVATKKMKKSPESIKFMLQLVMKSGTYMLGPALRKSEIQYYATLAKTGVHHYSGNSTELGRACGEHYRVCTLAITGPGDSAIIRHMPEQTGEK
ncbi:hypothetical protein FD755_015699 [Muntiacus reevesi]|uniref:Ribosomal protein eL8/eL30/eS12/Gadd45 domain-containing protein n=1 Tax=Muntiacus reevesi TaxID=9886 RepID=A0A5N3XI75_MUNRE|nr:hypothetical protein FD755_015699 [Muntiacus reevesi]